jgi:lipid II:glycine glycyltransferase (peptidoglycan interpeptide bridge formation enzyme)
MSPAAGGDAEGFGAERAGVEADARWDSFVAGTPHGSYLQLAAWAQVKAVNGWRSVRLEPGEGSSIGAQVLVRRPRPLPWAFAYAPRGPVATGWSGDAVAAFSARLRHELPRAAGRVSHVRVDPEVEALGPEDLDGSLRGALRDCGWQPAPPIQPERTRVIDLTADESALWSDLRKKWRQYVNRARSGGVRVVEADGDRLGEFYRIYRETADRAGFLIRSEAAYRGIWAAYRPAGRVSLLFAETPDGEPVATLFLVRCGDRVVEPYGGMTAAGAESRANYLLKWEAISRSRAAGAGTYDLWGLAHPGIAHFKTGFGGREVAYIGAWDLVLDGLGRRTYSVAQATRVRLARRRHGLASSGSAAAYTGDDG